MISLIFLPSKIRFIYCRPPLSAILKSFEEDGLIRPKQFQKSCIKILQSNASSWQVCVVCLLPLSHFAMIFVHVSYKERVHRVLSLAIKIQTKIIRIQPLETMKQDRAYTIHLLPGGPIAHKIWTSTSLITEQSLRSYQFQWSNHCLSNSTGGWAP